MSDWGRVAFYFDYEKVDYKNERQRIQGLISKPYKYPGVTEMVLHAYNGIRYFMERQDSSYYSPDGTGVIFDLSDYAELCSAFDTFFELGVIRKSSNSVEDALKMDKDSDYVDIMDELFNCEGMYGWLYFSFTGNPEAGYKLKYGYYYGKRDYEYEVRTLKDCWDISNKYGMEEYEELVSYVEEAISYLEEKAEFMNDEEYESVSELGTEWVVKIKSAYDSVE